MKTSLIHICLILKFPGGRGDKMAKKKAAKKKKR